MDHNCLGRQAPDRIRIACNLFLVGSNGSEVSLKVKGAGKLLVYSNLRPKKSLVDGSEAAFECENGGKLKVDVTWKQDKN